MHWAPGIPCALCYLRANGLFKTSGASRREIGESYVKLLRLFENLNRPRVQNSRRPGQASIVSADPGPITTDVCCYAKLGLQRAHQLAFVVMGPRFRGDDKCRQSDLSAVAQRAKAEATKQSIVTIVPAMDCFAEPVIGRAFARPVGSQ